MKHSTKKILSITLLFIGLLFIKNIAYSMTDTTGIPFDSKPRGISINPVTGIAVITNEKSNTASMVDLDNQKVLAVVSVGRSPRGVAIDGISNIALVSNTHDDSVSIIDLYTQKVVATVPTGKSPEGIAVNPLTRRAIVANRADNTVSVIDLITFKKIDSIFVGNDIIDLSTDPDLKLALAVSENSDSVSMIDLDTHQETGRVVVGKKPGSIAINPETHLAVVANEKDDSISIINCQTLQVTTVSVKKHPMSVAVNELDNTALVVCDEDRSLIHVDLDTKTVIGAYPLNKLPRGVAVNNITNIAAIVDDKTDSLTVLQLPNPVPEIISITPDNAERAGNDVSVIIAGNRFIKTSTVSIGPPIGIGVTPVFIDNHHIHATIPKKSISKAGHFPVTVINPVPNGGASNGASFTVNNPAPAISALDPAETKAGGERLTLNIYGTGYFDDTEIFLGGIKKSSTVVSNSVIQAGLTAEDIKLPGTYEVTARNISPGGGASNIMMLTVKSPLEVKITSPLDNATVNKARTPVRGIFKAGSQDIGITVNGKTAEIMGNEWVVNDVPLIVGANILTATIKDSAGGSVNAAISINTASLSQPVRLSANLTSGITPFTTYFSVSTEMTNPIVSYKLDYEGDGVVDYAGPPVENISHTYSHDGIFYPTITVIDSQGNANSDTIALAVVGRAEIETLLKGKWEGMKQAFKHGGVEEGLEYFVERSKERYGSVFGALKDQLPAILETFIEFNIIDVYERIAEYEVIADEGGVLYSYPGIFIRDVDGRWKFRDF